VKLLGKILALLLLVIAVASAGGWVYLRNSLPAIDGEMRAMGLKADVEVLRDADGIAHILAASGHVAGVINPPARNKRSHWLNDDVEGDPESWFAQAEEKPGSWWPDWDVWMRHHSNGTIPAPTQQGNAQYHPIEPAPGRYVKLKSN